MKEKIKKFFMSKNLWNTIYLLICGILLYNIGYFIGFSNGLLIENDIRDNMIVEINNLINDDKNDKFDIDINKKESFDNDTISVEFNTIAASLSSNKNDIGYLYIKSIYTYDYDFYYVDNVPNLRINYLDIDISWFLSFYIANYGEFEEISLNSSNDTSIVLNFHLEVNQVIDINNFYVTSFAPIGYANSDETIFAFLTEVVSSNDSNLNYSFAYVLNENDFNSFITSYEYCALSLVAKAGEIFTQYDSSATIPMDSFQNQSVLLANLNEFIVPKIDLVNSILVDIGYNTGLANGTGGGASQEELQQAWQTGFNIGYDSGIIEGKSEFVNSQEYRDILDNKYNEGIDKGKEIRDEEYLQTQSFFDEVWNFVTTATEKTLAIFNINILPGIPLYFLILIPIAIGLLSWVFKLLQR